MNNNDKHLDKLIKKHKIADKKELEMFIRDMRNKYPNVNQTLDYLVNKYKETVDLNGYAKIYISNVE